jgi:hypothetical protein
MKDDYLLILSTFITPVEVENYFLFREQLIEKQSELLNEVSEISIIGQYLSGKHSSELSIEYVSYFKLISSEVCEWDIRIITKNLYEKTIYQENLTDYYPIMKEMAKLIKDEAREFKQKFFKAIEIVKNEQRTQPYGIVISRLDCGFLFIPCRKQLRSYYDYENIFSLL